MPVKHLVKNVAAAATPEALSATRLPAAWVQIQAKNTNTNPVFVGQSGVDNAGNAGRRLAAGQVAELQPTPGQDPYDLSQIFIAVTTAGEGVFVLFGQL